MLVKSLSSQFKTLSHFAPVRELKGFELVDLKAGETKTIYFTLNKETLGFYNNDGEYMVEPGDFKIFVGGSSITSLEADFILN